MTPIICCAVPECGESLVVDYRHVDNLAATPWLCREHTRETREQLHPKKEGQKNG